MADSKQILIDSDLHRRLKAHVATLGVSTMKSYVEAVLEHAIRTNGTPMDDFQPPDGGSSAPDTPVSQPPDPVIPPRPMPMPEVGDASNYFDDGEISIPEPDPDPEPDPELEPDEPEEPKPSKRSDSWGVAVSDGARVRGDDW